MALTMNHIAAMLRYCLAGVLLGSFALCVNAADDIVILYVGEPDAEADFGARQGLSEANAQGEFLGVTYRLARDEESGAPRAVVAAVSAERLGARADAYPDTPVFNVTATETELREACRPNVFHVIPSLAMYADAERQWHVLHPDSSARARAWHASFRKYAAAQLNIRFREQFGLDMDDAAWAGWAALKLLSDTIARQPKLAGPILIDELKTNLAFDGQKGVDMSFRETGQLRQPLLLVDNDKVVAEAPVRGVVNADNLDSLGLPFCPK